MNVPEAIKKPDSIWNPALKELKIHLKDYWLNPMHYDMRYRQEFVRRYCWSPPSNTLWKHIAPFNQHIIEIGAGTGYWMHYLIQFGFRVEGYDIQPYFNRHANNRYADVKIGSYDVLAGQSGLKYQDSALLLSWPPYDNPMAFQSLRAFQGNTLIYIGEGHGGCTGDDEFHDLIEAEWTLVYRTPYKSTLNFEGIHSAECIYRRIQIKKA